MIPFTFNTRDVLSLIMEDNFFITYVYVYVLVEASSSRRSHYRRICSLPNPSDALVDELRKLYYEPHYCVRLSNILF